MKYKHTIEIITKDIQDIENLIRNFSNYSRIPAIELDLVLSKLRNMYEVLALLRNEDSETANNHELLARKINSDASQDKSSPAQNYTDEMAPDIHEKQKKDVTHTTEDKPPKEQVQDNEAPLSAGKKDPDEMTKKESILAEKFENHKLHINEKLAREKGNSDISGKIQSKPITSIAGSMGINDKFLFIRELFDGNSDHFRETCNKLDEAGNFNEAFNYLENSFEWDMKDDAVQQLLNLVRRKFITRTNE